MAKRWTSRGRAGDPHNTYAYQKARKQVREEEDVCHLCGALIDKGLPRMHPYSFQVDHIIPATLGGPHTRDNLRAAHKRCNDIRGRLSIDDPRLPMLFPYLADGIPRLPAPPRQPRPRSDPEPSGEYRLNRRPW